MRMISIVIVGAALCGACEQNTKRLPVYPAAGTDEALAAQPAAARARMPSFVPAIRPGTSPTRYEYLCLDEAHLNEAGAQGWELAIAVPMVSGASSQYSGYTVSTSWFCLKRALPDAP
jgi:hypothetical protein